MSNPHVHFKWKDNSGARQTGMAMSDYTMKLQFGKSENDVIPGSIELEFKGNKPISLKGDFVAGIK